MEEIITYNKSLSAEDRKICDLLFQTINENLPDADCKVWHAHPVWFLDGNPIVGYSKRKDNVQLLFWSGQSFDESGLDVEGSFKAAQKRYNSVDEIDVEELKRWLKNPRKFNGITRI